MVASSSPTRKVAETGLHGEATVMKREYRVRGREKTGKKDKKVKKNIKIFCKKNLICLKVRVIGTK